MDIGTLRTGSRRICFINPLDHYPHSRRFLAQVASKLPMRPLADLLVYLLSKAHPGLDVAYISYRDPAHSRSQKSTTLRAA